ncbi:pep2-like protein [Fusarium austroafricanum]|uniref:Pep2-like protein n=1 Tax=Fusarium austroafricanum TaxID=2364996 RepID=A0A8H4NEN0_9HYPO|nr:pep2-like protein [Fusarium austroafricanum]
MISINPFSSVINKNFMAMAESASLPKASRPAQAIRNNGSNELAMERYKLRELAEGWPCYRDACEWDNFESIFHPDAYVYTTWSGRTHYKDFISLSKVGVEKGSFIMHRCNGITTDITADATRAVTKMKATITQKFTLDGCEVDAESDCRFCFFWTKETGDWKAMYVRHWYEKDKLIPVDPRKIPEIDDDHLMAFPSGYRYLAYCQEKTMGVEVARDMPGHLREKAVGGNEVAGDKHDKVYWQIKDWLDGKEVDI